MCGAAYASHLLLDWLGADNRPAARHPAAVAVQSSVVHLGPRRLPADRTPAHLLAPPRCRRNVLAIAQEIAILLPLCAALWLVRVKALAGLSPELTRRDHPAQQRDTAGTSDRRGRRAAR